jgi:hypothetical protein
MSKYNSKGQLIEELDIHLDPLLKKVEQNSKDSDPLFTTQVPSEKVEQNSTNSDPPFQKEEEILAWCEAYQNLKKRGIHIYKV